MENQSSSLAPDFSSSAIENAAYLPPGCHNTMESQSSVAVLEALEDPASEKNQVPVLENPNPSMHIDIEPHGHLKQVHFPHLASTVGHHKSTATEHKVLLVMQAVSLDESDIQSYLVEVCRMHAIGEKNVQISNVMPGDGATSCKITFPSGKMARKFKTDMDKIEEVTLCHARIWDESCDIDLVKSSLKKRMEDILETSASTLKSHQAKQEEIRAKLRSGQGKRHVSEINDLLEERRVLQQKLQELLNQEKEFTTFMEVFQDKFLKISPNAHWKKKASLMEKRYEIEAERLQSALPMYAKRSEIVQMIAQNQVSILLGETGSGKSTQVTQYLYEAGLAGQKKIVCTQPRKVAATSLAKRVSTEMQSRLGDAVGYRVGMQQQLSKNTGILYVTDHILLKECLVDPLLTKYSCVIIDEAHERSLNTDLLLGMIKRALIHRPELRVIITSATINPDVFVAFFSGCPVLKVSGRVFPVEVIYSDEPADPDSNFLQRAVLKAFEVAQMPEPGDILVFLTTPLETEQACEKMQYLARKDSDNLMCLALHGKTQASDQQKVFNPTPDGERKIVFATNSAETSVTIPGIKVVIDTGLAKEKLYDHKKNMSSLTVTKISQSSANQRKGRAGRTERGKCYRLYREDDFESMDVCSKPEIMKVHLGMALLTLLSFDIEDPLSFDFVEMPPREGLEKAMDVLLYLDAVDENGKLTQLGRKLAAMSLEPRMAKIVLNGIDRNIAFESILIAALSTMGGSMFYRGGSESQKQEADKLKVRFCNPRGDIHTMLDVYKEWNCQPEKTKNKWCMDNSINAKSMRMVRESVHEIQNTLSTDLGIKIHQTFHEDEKYMEDMVEAVIFESYAMNLCVYAGHPSLGYMAATEPDKLVHVHPSSALNSLAKSPCYMVYENTLTTSRAFVINITCISDCSFETFCKRGKPVVDVDEINSRITSPRAISDVGTATLKKFCGAKHSARRALEKELQVHFDTEMLVLEVDVEQGTVSVYTLPRVKDECHKLVLGRIIKEQESFYQDEIERPLVEGCTTRVVIGHGLETKCLLFADEFRTIYIPSVPPNYDAEDLVKQFQKLAVVTNHEITSSKARNNSGLKLTFEHHDAAEKVLKLLGGTESEFLPGIIAKPDIVGPTGVPGPYAETMSARVTWCRRQIKGIAYVKFDCQSIARCVLAKMSSIPIGGHFCAVHFSKKNADELYMRNIPKWLTNDEVSLGIRISIREQTSYEPKDVIVPNDPPMHTSEADCEQYKRDILELIEFAVPGVSGLEINMKKPTDKAVQYVAFITLKNLYYAEGVKKALQGGSLRGKGVRATFTLRSSMFVREDIFYYIREDLEHEKSELKKSIHGLHCEGRPANGGHRVEIKAETIQDLTDARTRLAKCINGTKLDIEKSEHLKYFKQVKKGQQFIVNVQRQCGVHIIIDKSQSVIVLHGSQEGIKEATQQIMKQVQQLTQSCIQVFDLKAQFPPGMSKRLMSQYGLELQELERVSGADMVTLQLRQHSLTVHGSQEAVENVQKLLDAQAAALGEGKKQKKPTSQPSLPDCPICFCEPDRSEVYRLEYCGHVYCENCIKGMLDHAVRDKHFPIQCANAECNKDIVLQDVFALIGTSMERLKPFIAASVDCYMKTHGDEFKYCITPDCDMVYAVSKGDVHTCQLCQIRICTRCHSECHPCLTCELNKEMKDKFGGQNFDQYSQETWLAEDPANRALCPKCKTGIEKNGGCSHMHCTQCNTHICWKCKATFLTSGEAYNHIDFCSGTA